MCIGRKWGRAAALHEQKEDQKHRFHEKREDSFSGPSIPGDVLVKK